MKSRSTSLEKVFFTISEKQYLIERLTESESYVHLLLNYEPTVQKFILNIKKERVKVYELNLNGKFFIVSKKLHPNNRLTEN